ncbi:MAG: ABC transporter substrate-binding protein [Ruminococcus sp.]|nr:ABC transporter substrate-binding protein [Ruminococcus sp.]
MSRIFNHKRIPALLMAVILTASLCACTSSDNTETTATTAPAKYSIGVIRSYNDTDSEHIYQGFSSAFTDKGYYQSEFHSVSIVNCDGDKDKCKEAAEQFVSDGVSLIFAIGEPAAVAVAKATDTIPVIFADVTDPIEAGLLKSCEKPDKNVTGVSNLTPVFMQLQMLTQLLPEAKKISSIYMTTDENSILISTLAESDAETLGLDYTPCSAASEEQLDTCIKNALEDCDALYLIEDKFTTDNADKIIKAATKKKIPVITTSEVLFSSGALATSVPDCTDMGYNAGELALILLKNLRQVGDLSVEYPDVCINKINSQAAETFGIDTATLENFKVVG